MLRPGAVPRLCALVLLQMTHSLMQLPVLFSQAGVDIFRVFDSLNDIDQLRFGIGKAVRRAARQQAACADHRTCCVWNASTTANPSH